MFPNKSQYLQVQPPGAEAPLPLMTVSALKIRTAHLKLWRYVPASAAFICNEREIVNLCNLPHDDGVMMYGSKAVGDREGRAF